MELSTLFFFERHGELNRDQKKYRLSAEYNYNISIGYFILTKNNGNDYNGTLMKINDKNMLSYKYTYLDT